METPTPYGPQEIDWKAAGEEARRILREFYDSDLTASEAVEQIAMAMGLDQERILCHFGPAFGNKRLWTKARCDANCPYEPHRCKAYTDKWGKP